MFNPKHHRVRSRSTRTGNLRTYILEYNTEAFDGALCRQYGTEAFYPSVAAKTDYEVAAALSICEACPVREACLEWGLAHETYGIWGGTTQADRAAIRRRHGMAVTDPYVAFLGLAQ